MWLCLKVKGDQSKVLPAEGQNQRGPEWNRIWILPLYSCVILHKLLNLSEPQYAVLKNGGNNIYLTELL